MTPEFLLESAIGPALTLLGPKFCSPQAQTILVATAIQESGLRHRKQVRGPAKGWWQFEKIGVRGVLEHPATQADLIRVCRELHIMPTVDAIHAAIEFNDVLAAALARLNYWTASGPIPSEQAPAYGYYIKTWRPGKPDISRWPDAWESAVRAVYG